MKKKLLLSVICVMLMSLGIVMSGCGSGETYDAGNVSCAVPDGWKVFTSEELFNSSTGDSDEDSASDEDSEDPNSIYIYKDAKETTDILKSNGITILYSDDKTMGSIDDMKSFYEKAKDQDPLKLDNYEWKCFTGQQFEGNFEYAVLEAIDGDASIQVNVILKNGDKTISLDDKDVKEIIESIKITDSGDDAE